MRQALVAGVYGAAAGMIAAAVLGAMQGLEAVLWAGEPSALRIFLTILAGGALIAGLRRIDGGQEDDLAAQLRQAGDPSAFHWRRSALLAAMAILAVAFGGAIGPEAGTLAVVSELSAIVSLAIARSAADRQFIGEVGAAAALGGLYGSPPGGTLLAEPAAEGPQTEPKAHQILLFLAAVAGLAGFLLAAKVLLPGGGMRVHLPPAAAPDAPGGMVAAVIPATFGGLPGWPLSCCCRGCRPCWRGWAAWECRRWWAAPGLPHWPRPFRSCGFPAITRSRRCWAGRAARRCRSFWGWPR